jgi:hypothetical protein
MKLNLLVITKDGHYAERSAEISDVSEAGKAVKDLVDAIPDEIRGEKLLDWTQMKIEIIRKP